MCAQRSSTPRHTQIRPKNAGVVAEKPQGTAAVMDDPFANAALEAPVEIIEDDRIPEGTIVAMDSEQISESEMDALLRRMGWIKANEASAPVMAPPSKPDGVEFWNPYFINEELVLRTPGPKGLDYDPATEVTIKFMGGYFLATQDWQVEAIEKHIPDRAFRADILENAPDIVCEKCGWTTRSSRAFAAHRAQES